MSFSKKTDSKEHTIIAGNNKINVAKEFIDKAFIGTDKKKDEKITFFISKDIKKTEEVYKFFAKNTNVEWNYSEFENKSKVAVLSSTQTVSIKEKAVRFMWDLLAKNKDLKLIRNSHSHPSPYIPDTGYPAYPSGFKADGEIDFETPGDRDAVELFYKEFRKRQPTLWEIFVPTAPNLKVTYDQIQFKVINTDEK